MVEVRSAFHVLGQPVGEVVVIGSGAPGGGIAHSCQGSTVVVAVGNGVPILPGLLDQPAVSIITILHTIAIAVWPYL